MLRQNLLLFSRFQRELALTLTQISSATWLVVLLNMLTNSDVIFLSLFTLSTVQSLIRSGTATGFLLRPLAATMPDLAVLSLEPQVFVHVSLVWRRSQKPFRDMSRLIELCRQVPVL